LVSWFSGK